MKIEAITKNASLEISTVEVIPAGVQCSGDFRVLATVECEGFSGRNDSIWLSQSDFQTFLTDLQQLDVTRQGAAQLESMSPGELRLKIFSTSSIGHISASGTVAKLIHFQTEPKESIIAFELELDPSCLAKIVTDFSNLVPST